LRVNSERRVASVWRLADSCARFLAGQAQADLESVTRDDVDSEVRDYLVHSRLWWRLRSDTQIHEASIRKPGRQEGKKKWPWSTKPLSIESTHS
jgi:hypothetical protein